MNVHQSTGEPVRRPITRRPITRRLMRLLVAATAVSVAAVLGVALTHQLNVARTVLQNERDLIASSSVPILSHLVWVVNEEQTIQMVTGLARHPTINAARLDAEGMNPITIRTESFREHRDERYAWSLVHYRDGQVLVIGQLEVWMPRPINLPNQYAGMFIGIGLGTLATFVVVGLFWYVARRQVTGPMVELARDIMALHGAVTLPEWWHERTDQEPITETYQIRTAVEETMQSLAQSVADKEVLLREVHHRVKNNLQLVSSLLALQENGTEDPAGRRALQDSQNRVLSMALVHELLYQGAAGEYLEFADYLRNLASGLQPGPEPDIRIEVGAEPAAVGIEAAIPAGLIVTELVTNAIKHAYPAGRAGRVAIRSYTEPAGETAPGPHASASDSVSAEAPARLIVEVRDWGVGLPKGWDPEQSTSLGMRIASSLSMQLGSRLLAESDTTGSHFRFSLPRWQDSAG